VVTDDCLVAAAHRIGDELLRPDAERVDVEGVPRSHLDALAAAGLMRLMPPDTGRAVAEELAAADASTWFVWTQHYTPMRTVARGDNAAARAEWLPRLEAGEWLAGVAFTHLRRPGAPPVVVRRDGDGWVVDGDLAWVTSWELADVFCVGAQLGDDEVAWMLVPLRGRDGVTAGPLRLAAMGGTSTARVRLEHVRVAADEVLLVEPLAKWRAADAAKVIDASPALFGVTAEALRRLRERDAADTTALADALQSRLDELRASAYALADQDGAPEERLAVRAEAHQLALTATAAVVAAGAGRSMLLDAPAQRLARVALFLLVQGQTAPVRAAQLHRLAAGATPERLSPRSTGVGAGGGRRARSCARELDGG
jgi:alkylation response protein AidB-like acyl-CoA dehydrogenase